MFALRDDVGFCKGIWVVAGFSISEFKIQNFKVKISNCGEDFSTYYLADFLARYLMQFTVLTYLHGLRRLFSVFTSPS